MPRYKVQVYGQIDGLVFPDLLIKYSSGYFYPLRVKLGEYVPSELFDPLDIQRSLLTGSLGSFIKNKAVMVEYSDIELRKMNKQPRKKKQEQIIAPQPTPLVEAATPIVQPPVVEQTSPGKPEHIDFKDVAKTDDFLKLSYFRRLEFIKQCNDKSLLTQLSEKLESQQLKFQIDIRLKEI